MADEKDENTETRLVGKITKSFGSVKLIIAGLVVVILAAGIAFGVAMLAVKSVSHGETAKGDGNGKGKSETIGLTYDAGEYITNLDSKSGKAFIKINIVLAFQEEKVQEEITNKIPEIKHTINSLLRQQTPEFLAEPRAMEKLAELLKKSINTLLVKGNVTNVYFTSFVVQQQ